MLTVAPLRTAVLTLSFGIAVTTLAPLSVSAGTARASGATHTAPAPAEGWTAPVELERREYGYYRVVQGAGAPDGSAVVAYRPDGPKRLFTRVRDGASAHWGPRLRLRQGYFGEPAVAVVEGGAATAVTTNLRGVRLDRGTSTGWSSTHQLRVPFPGPVAASTSPNGTVAVLTELENRLVVAVHTVADGWRRLPDLELDLDIEARAIAVTDDGRVAVAVVEPTDNWMTTLVLRHDPDEPAWRTSRVDPPPGWELTIMTGLAASADGDVSVMTVERREDVGDRTVVSTASWTEEPQRTVLPGSRDRPCPSYVDCADFGFAASGQLVVVWNVAGAEDESDLLIATRQRDGSWAEPATVPLADPIGGVRTIDVHEQGSVAIRAGLDVASCPTWQTCQSIGSPRRWADFAWLRYGWITSTDDAGVHLVYGSYECETRCYAQPFAASHPGPKVGAAPSAEGQTG